MTTPQWEARPAPDSNYEWDIFNPAGVKVAEVLAFGPDRDGLEAEGNAKFLVLAANAYRPLVEALTELTPPSSWCTEPDGCPWCTARAAIALTREKESTC